MVKRIVFISATFLTILCLSIVTINKIRAPRRPNVIILLIDALRKDHVGVYGYYRETTPNMDRFSQDAIVFQNAISQCSWTSPSIAALFSSLYPSTHGCVSYSQQGAEVKADFLDHKIDTLAEILKEEGYETGAFVANHWICRRLQFDQGFDVFSPVNEKYKPRAPEVNEKAFKWISKNRMKPFFAYLHYMDVHGPYSPPPPYDSFFKSTEFRQMSRRERNRLRHLSVGRGKDKNNLNYYIDQYDGEIRYTDHHIGEFLERLRRYDLLDNTIVIITSDHGEAFFEHGCCGHGWTLYNEEIDIPLVIKFPQSVKFPAVEHYRVELIDVTATILSILNLRLPYNPDGLNLQHTSNGKMLVHRSVFSEELSTIMKGPPEIAIIKDNYKATYSVNEQKVTELYELDEDKAEKSNIYNINRAKAKELETEVKSSLTQKSRKRKDLGLENSAVTLDGESRNQLRSLGYVQ